MYVGGGQMSRVRAIFTSCGVLKSCMYFGRCGVGRVAAIHVNCVVQKKWVYMSVDVRWADLEQFMQNVVCHKMAF